MLIWSRWGFLSILAIPLGGLPIGFGLTALFGLPNSGIHVPTFLFAGAALVNFALTRWAYPRLDRPKPATITRKIEPPYTDEHGVTHEWETVPVYDPEGNPLVTAPRSTVFFFPARYAWIVCAVASAGFAIGWITS